MKKKTSMRILAVVMTIAMLFAFAVPAFAANKEVVPKYSYTAKNGMTFDKISHPDTPVKQADGVVDYIGNGLVAPYVQGESELGKGDRGQSYSYASASYGDWVYINTMYGGNGASNILTIGMGGMSPEAAKAMMDVMYNGHMYTSEPDGAYAGAILFKFNVKTGETVLLMSQEKNQMIPTFRNAVEFNGKLYFVGMVIDMTKITPEEAKRAIMMQDGFPRIYEIDPANNDKITCVYDCVDVDGFRYFVKERIFPSTRAISTYKDNLVIAGLNTDGVFLAISNDPSKGQSSFTTIADMDDLFNYPAIKRSDVNGGGGIYQVIEYNNRLYVVICTGTPANANKEKGTLQPFAIVRGDCIGDPMKKESWKWSVLAGDKKDGAKYPFGLDEERYSAGACSLEVYGDYLYIGDYNDVSSALQGIAMKKSFKIQETNLQQSINLYRMDKDENVEMVVGDPTKQFPKGGISGLGSGYLSHMNQYTWQTEIYNGKMYVSTMDTTTYLEPLAQFTNGDFIGMSKEEWQNQINYVKVLIQLMMPKKNAKAVSAEAAVANAVDEASGVFAKNAIKLDAEKFNELAAAVKNGSVFSGQLTNDQVKALKDINKALDKMTKLIDTNNIEEFAEQYSLVSDMLDKIVAKLPPNVQGIYKVLSDMLTKENLVGVAKSIKYMRTSERGFDLYEITNKDDGSVDIKPVTTDGFGDPFNHGLRIFEEMENYFILCTANPFYGTQIWRLRQDKNVTDPTDPAAPTDPAKPEDPTDTDNPTTPGNADKPADSTDGGSDKVEIPGTGDTSAMAILVLMAAASAGVAVTYRKKRK